MSNDKPVPWEIETPCPTEGCPQTLTVRWPAADPDEVDVRCHRCGGEATVERSDAEEPF